jgi:peptide deformylase
VSVSIAFLDQEGDEQQEKLTGTVAWVKPWEKGYLIGVVWDVMITQEQNRWLFSYLNETLKETA